jgi:hypothetical protein
VTSRLARISLPGDIDTLYTRLTIISEIEKLSACGMN